MPTAFLNNMGAPLGYWRYKDAITSQGHVPWVVMCRGWWASQRMKDHQLGHCVGDVSKGYV